VFKYFLISIALVPLLVGVGAAARAGDLERRRSALRIGWLVYATLWFGVLYYLRFRWS
jgi:hypothetical protein